VREGGGAQIRGPIRSTAKDPRGPGDDDRGAGYSTGGVKERTGGLPVSVPAVSAGKNGSTLRRGRDQIEASEQGERVQERQKSRVRLHALVNGRGGGTGGGQKKCTTEREWEAARGGRVKRERVATALEKKRQGGL